MPLRSFFRLSVPPIRCFSPNRPLPFQNSKLPLYRLNLTPSEVKSSFFRFLAFSGVCASYFGSQLFFYDQNFFWLCFSSLGLAISCWKMVSLHWRLPKIVLKLSLHANGEEVMVVRLNNYLQVMEESVRITEIERADKRHWYLAKKGIVFRDGSQVFWISENGKVEKEFDDIFHVVLEGRKIKVGDPVDEGK